MDPSTAFITNQEHDDIYDTLFRTMFHHLEKGEIPEDTARESVVFYMEQLDIVKTHAELLSFLAELSKRYPIYYNAYISIKDQLQSLQKVDHIKNQLEEIGGNQ